MNQLATYEKGLSYQELYEDHKNWIIELEFFLGELFFFESMLEKYARLSELLSAKPLLEQIQNKLIVQRQTTEQLMKLVQKEENKLLDFIRNHTSIIEFSNFQDHKNLRSKVTVHRKLYLETKFEFYSLISQTS